MKKFLLSILAVMLTVLSVQAEEYSYSLAKNDGTQFGDVTWDGVKWTISADNTSYCQWDGNNSKGYQFGSSKQSCKTLTLSTSGIEGTITKIVVNTSGASSINASLTVSVGGIQYGNSTKLTSASTDYTFENTTSSASGEIKLSYANSSSKAIYIKSIAITYETTGEGGGETPEPDQPETPVAPAAPTLPASCNFDNLMTVEITNIADGATAYYTTDGTTPSAASTKYTAPFEITATTTVMAIAVNEGVSSEVASATYTKNEPVTPPTEGEVVDVLNRELTGVTSTSYVYWSGITVSSDAVYAGQSAGSYESIQLKSKDSTSGIVTTQSGGKAKKVVVDWNSNTSSDRTLDVYGKNSAYAAATDLYSASTQGTKLGSIKNGTSELIINGDYEYIGLRSNSGAMYLTSISITWDASAGVTVLPDAPALPAGGDFFVSKDIEIANFNNYEDGTVVYYSINGGDFVPYTESFTITDNSTIVAYAINGELKSAESTAEYTRIANDPVITVVGDTDADAFEESIEVEIETQNGAKAYYTLNNDEPTEESTEYKGTLTIKATATLKVIAVEDGGYKSKNVVAKTFTMALKDTSVDADASNATFDATSQDYENQESVASVTITDGITVVFDKGTNSNDPKFYSSGTAIRCYGGNSFTITSTIGTITKIVLTYGSSDGTNTITTDCGDFSTNTWVGKSNSVVFTIGGTSGNRRIQKITVTYGEPENESYSLNVTEAGWATLFLDYAVAIPAGVTCYVIEEGAFDGETVELTELKNYIPANTGVIVKAESEEYVFEPVKEDAGVVGLMSGSTSNKYFFEKAYVLANGKDGVGLYLAEMTGGAWLNNANKAYLPAPADAEGVKSYSFRFGEGTTAIENVEVENTVKAIYDLTGRKVETISAPGIYIINGVKRVVR